CLKTSPCPRRHAVPAVTATRSPTPPDPRNLTNELAKERNRDAAERTLMAGIRTSLSLISFGFGVD
ncbi:MAG: YidH family protein, partial [Cyanobacteriota bacterium]